MTRRLCTGEATGRYSYEFRRVAFVAIAAAAVRFSTPSYSGGTIRVAGLVATGQPGTSRSGWSIP